MNLGSFVEDAAISLPDDVYQNPRQTARHMLQCLLGISQMEIHLRPEQALSAQQTSIMEEAIASLKKGLPLAYVLGELTFLEWDFYCDSRAFIPRPETEALIAMVREKARTMDHVNAILDMCCGTGVMGLSLALSFPSCQVILSELSEDALAVTRKNIARYGLESRVSAIQSDLWQQIPENKSFDLIVCNPPYVAGNEHVDRQVMEHEPHMALFSDDDGLAHVKLMLLDLDRFLNRGGLAAFELGHTHSEKLNSWLKQPRLEQPKLEQQSFSGEFTWEADPFGVRRFLLYQK